MQELKERIQKEGKVLPGNIVKVDGFLNHRVDCQLMGRMADEFARIFDISKVDLIPHRRGQRHRAGGCVRLQIRHPDGLCEEG